MKNELMPFFTRIEQGAGAHDQSFDARHIFSFKSIIYANSIRHVIYHDGIASEV